MGIEIVCPHCDEKFFRPGSMKELHCPACAEAIPGSGAPPVPAAASVPPAKGKVAGLQRACPACGASYPGDQRNCPSCGVSYRVAKAAKEDEGGAYAPEKAGIRKGVLGGIIMIAIAAVWFFGGLAAGYIFYYPPILAVIGIYSIIKGLATGNLAGEKAAARRRRR